MQDALISQSPDTVSISGRELRDNALILSSQSSKVKEEETLVDDK